MLKSQLITYGKITFERRRKGKDVPGYLGIKKDQVLGRVYTMHPGNTECYHLRLLLHECQGPTSFSALKTVDGVIHPTSQAACRAHGLLKDDANWDRTLEEACISDSPYKIRELFAIIELAYDSSSLAKVVAENVPKLNVEQKHVYNEILNSIMSNSGQLYFLDAPGGTGKTFLINLLLAKIRSEKNIAVVVASSGIAATLIEGGETAHSAFKLPLNLGCSEYPLCNMSKQSDMAHVLREAKVITWDECTMAHKKGIEALNRTLQDIQGCDRIMGGVVVLLAGDFRQTLPVVPRGTRADEVKACIKSSILWPSVKVLPLTINMRLHLQPNSKAEEFSKLLIDIGNCNTPEVDGRIKVSCIGCEIVPELITLTDKIYPNIDKAGNNCSSWLKERAILTPTNKQANYINNFLLEKISTEQVRYESVDAVTEEV
ncbi:ATP-dependent DNA helicase pif1 [Eumeta japonica]|uniref:ATP-dependent DNA helicase n=1 Tax=Eumeta variegata TaxID=151549 RepID=A0A4C1VPD1_EUMVA|nr:ATP-dependent DNA helicase pif1 [Eumeta japonica]